MRIPGYKFDPSKRVDGSLIFAVAVWLIFNSHTEAFHPYPWMAADGMLGNALFYFISGFGIQSSLSGRAQGFGEFAARRLVRIYVPLLIVGLIFWVTLDRNTKADFFQAFATYVYPTNYTYIKVILPCYAGLWLLSRLSTRWWYASIGVALILMVGVYLAETPSLSSSGRLSLGSLPELLWDSYFWILVVSGAAVARWQVQPAFTRGRVMLMLVLLGAYFGAKFVLVAEGWGVAFFPVLFVLVFAMCALGLTTFGTPSLVKHVMGIPWLGQFLGLSAALTLEIYLVHEPLAHVAAISGITYPLNLLALLALTLPVAIAVGVTSGYIQRRIEAGRATKVRPGSQ
jgi:hypothetical protein